MLSSNERAVDLANEPSQDREPPNTTDDAAPNLVARQRATPRDENTRVPLPNLASGQTQAPIGNSYPAIPQLSPQQLTAISLLLVGHSAAATAAILGIHRGTLHRWKSRHPAFIAELNRRQAEALEAARTRLTNLMLKTLDLVHSSLTRGQPDDQIDHAYKLFKMLPCRQLAAAPITGPTELEPATDAAIRASKNLPEGAPITHEDREHYLKTLELREDQRNG